MKIQSYIYELLENLDLRFPYVPVLAYHHFMPATGVTDDPDYAIPVSLFEKHMRFLHDQGYICLSLMELLCPQKQTLSRGKKAFALTFDDGFDDFFTQAYPVLRHYAFTATIFLVTDRIGGWSDWEGEQGARMLTWAQIKILSENKISFGSHTCSHSCLLRLRDEQIRYELSVSKECLETKLQREIQLFAYPFGESSPKIRRMVEDAGYDAAFGVRTGKPGRYNWWRCECRAQDNMKTFSFRLTWANIFLQKIRGWAREETSSGRFLRKMKHR